MQKNRILIMYVHVNGVKRNDSVLTFSPGVPGSNLDEEDENK